MTVQLDDVELRAWQALLHAHEQLIGTLDAELREEHELSLTDYDVLVRLARAPDGWLRMSDLAEKVMRSPGSLTRRVDRLVDQGLVHRARSDPDARVMRVRLAEDGKRLVRRAARTHLRGIRQHFSGRLTREQLEAIAPALEAIAGPHEPH